MRWLRRLADADMALDRTMIPLGSCTMKLNAAVEMEPITWPEFADLHPFAPDADTAGTLELIADLERWLAELTGYAAVSLQPNAGSQGDGRVEEHGGKVEYPGREDPRPGLGLVVAHLGMEPRARTGSGSRPGRASPVGSPASSCRSRSRTRRPPRRACRPSRGPCRRRAMGSRRVADDERRRGAGRRRSPGTGRRTIWPRGARPSATSRRAASRSPAVDAPEEVVRGEEDEASAEVAVALDDVVGVRGHVLAVAREDDEVVEPRELVAARRASRSSSARMSARAGSSRASGGTGSRSGGSVAERRGRGRAGRAAREEGLPRTSVPPAVAVRVVQVVRLPGVRRQDGRDALRGGCLRPEDERREAHPSLVR